MNNIRKTLFTLLFTFISLFPLFAMGGNVFYSSALIYINTNEVKSVGTNETANAKARALTYRNSIIGESSFTNAHPPVYGGPAYISDEVGSSVFTTNLEPGQELYVISEVYNGLNEWTGDSYVGGAHQTLTSSIISNLGDDENNPFPHIVLEKIPTVEELSHTETSITLKWTGLSDRTDIYPNGSFNDSIVGYTIYRSSNSTSNPQKIGVVSQSAGNLITFTDNNVSQGVNYYYQIAVNFRWDSNLPDPWQETTARSNWSSSIYTSDPADAIKFAESSLSIIAGQKGGPIIINSYATSTGNITNTPVSITFNLSSDSSEYKFFEYNNGCTNNEISQVEIMAGSNGTSFCYYDTKEGNPLIEINPQNGWSSISQAQTILVGPLDHFDLEFEDVQVNDEVFSGINKIYAKDIGGNTITDYNSLQKWMGASISVSNGATLENFDLGMSDFVNGIADITLKNFKYAGPAGLIKFSVISNNGKRGETNVSIGHGTLDHIKILDSEGNVINNYELSVDNVLNLYAAGYDVSDNFFEITGDWDLLEGDLEGLNFQNPSNSLLLDPSIAFRSGKVRLTSNLKTTETGLITINHGTLDHFSLSQNIGEQTAGNRFDLGEIIAMDKENNIVKSFNSAANLSSQGNTISPSTTSNFVNGVLSSQEIILTSASSNFVSVEANQKTGQTNTFNVKHNVLDHFLLNFLSPQKNDQFFIGENNIIAQDEWNNTVLDFNNNVDISAGNATIINESIFVNGIANISQKLKYTGIAGNIEFRVSFNESFGSTTITIEPGDLSKVVIKEASNGAGEEAKDHLMKVGESYELYSAGYDVSDNYIGDISGEWQSQGSLDSISSDAASHIVFTPLLAETSGIISFTNNNGHSDSTQNIIVKRGDLHHFNLIFEEQINGIAFQGTNQIIAVDAGDNIITDFNQIGEDVVLEASNNATLTNNLFNPSDFINGVADVSAKGLIYSGIIGNIEFTANSNGKSGTGFIQIKLGDLDHFEVNIERFQDNNSPFEGVNTITAKDVGDNTITNFNALVDNVEISITPNVGLISGLGSENNNVLNQSSDFIEGVANLTGKLIYDGMEGTYIFNILSSSGKIGSSTNVEISIGPLDHFIVSNIQDGKAGQAFIFNVLAADITGNIKTSFNEEVTISDLTGTIEPKKFAAFESGGASIEVTITKAVNNNVITVNYGEAEGRSNNFKIGNGDLHHFSFEENIVNAIAGTELSLSNIIAQDQWGNTILDFNEAASLSDSTETISPITTNNFINGVLNNQGVNITKTRQSNIIKIDFEEKLGLSNAFEVLPGEVDHVLIKTRASGGGDLIEDYSLTADDSLMLYGAAYDSYENYISDAIGNWATTGNLDEHSVSQSTSIEFKPVKSETSGTITFAYNEKTVSTGIISVNHGSLDHFEIKMSNPQIVGEILSNENTIKALDKNNNIVTNFNAFSDNVVITADSNGRVIELGSGKNNILNRSTDFVNGVADLSSLGMIYAGSAGEITFEAKSSGDKIGLTTKILFASGQLDHFDFEFEGVQKNGEPFINSRILGKDIGGNIVTNLNAFNDNVEITVQPNNGVLSGIGSQTNNILNEALDFVEGIADVSQKLKYDGASGLHTFRAVSNITQKTGLSTEVDIKPGDLSYIKIIDSSDGKGDEINNKTILAGQSLELWAAGFDDDDNFIKNYSSKWVGEGEAFTNLSNLEGVKTTFSAIKPGQAIINVLMDGLRAETGIINVLPGLPAKIVFTNYPYDGEYINDLNNPHTNNEPLLIGEPSKAFSIQLQDIVGNIVGAEEDLTINLETNSGDANFSSSLGEWNDLNQITILSGQNSTIFYYKDNVLGLHDISVLPEDSSINPNSQKAKVVSKTDKKLVFETIPQTIRAGEITGIITISLEDNEGNPILADENISLNFASNSFGQNYFYADPNGSFNIVSGNIAEGENSISFYYEDYYANSSLITVSAEGFTSAYQIVEVLPANQRNLFIYPGGQGQNIVQNKLSQKITLGVRDQYNNLVNIEEDTLINLSSLNASGLFLTPQNGGQLQSNPSVILRAGQNQIYFYYEDSLLGEVEIRAVADNMGEAFQIETIVLPENTISQIVFITPQREIGTNISSEVITIETQDSFGNSIPVNGDKTISLFSNASSGSFALSPSGSWGISSVTILSGESQVSFYYKDAKPGTKTLGVSENPSLGWKDATHQITIEPNPVKKVAFVSEEQSVLANQSSQSITIALLDENNEQTFYSEDITILLGTNSSTGLFSLSNNGPWDLSSIIIRANNSSAKFYYKDPEIGTYILSAEALNLDIDEAIQNISIKQSSISSLSFTSEVQAISSSEISQKIKVEVQDEQGNQRILDSDTVVELKSTSNTGQFSLDGINWGMTSTIIKKGSSLIEFYYKDEGVGIFSLTVSETPEKGWNNAVQQISIGEFDNVVTKLSFTSSEPVIKAGEPSNSIKIQTVSIINKPINTDSNIDLLVSSDSSTGEFAKSITGPWEKNIILTIAGGTNSAEFYYRDSTSGEFNLSAKEYPEKGWDNALIKVNVGTADSTKVVFITPRQSILKNRASSPLTIQTQDSYGNIKTMEENALINLLSSSATGKFSLNGLNFEEISSVQILAGNSSASFYYKDTALGSFEIKAEKSGFNRGLQLLTVSEDALDRIVLLPEMGASQINSNFQFTAIAYNAYNAIIPDIEFNFEILDTRAGTIDENGLFNAGSNIGDYEEVIKVSANGKEALASVRIFGTTSVAQTETPSSSGGVIVINREVPLNASVVINDGDNEVISKNVKLTLYATGATHVKVSNNPDFVDAQNWLPYTGSLEWELKGEINKNNLVYVKFKNLAGGESAVANDAIKFVDKLSGIVTQKEPTQIIYNYYIIQQTESISTANVVRAPHIVSPISGALVLDNSIYLTGYAEPNSLITLSIHSNNEIIAKVVTDNTGKFIYRIEPNILEPGKHSVFATIEKDDESLVGPTTNFEVFSNDTDGAALNTNAGMTLITNVEAVNNSKLIANINILNFEGSEGGIIFNIKNVKGELILSYKDDFKTATQDISFTKSIKTSQKLDPGKYIFETQLNNGENKAISNINNFEIFIDQNEESFYNSSIFKLTISLWLVLIIVIIWGIRKILSLRK